MLLSFWVACFYPEIWRWGWVNEPCLEYSRILKLLLSITLCLAAIIIASVTGANMSSWTVFARPLLKSASNSEECDSLALIFYNIQRCEAQLAHALYAVSKRKPKSRTVNYAFAPPLGHLLLARIKPQSYFILTLLSLTIMALSFRYLHVIFTTEYCLILLKATNCIAYFYISNKVPISTY